MTDSTSHVIAAIDGALRDQASPDAMRWNPELKDARGEKPASVEFAVCWHDRARHRHSETVSDWAAVDAIIRAGELAASGARRVRIMHRTPGDPWRLYLPVGIVAEWKWRRRGR